MDNRSKSYSPTEAIDSFYSKQMTYQSITQSGYESDGRSVSDSEIPDPRLRYTSTSLDGGDDFEDDGLVEKWDEFWYILRNAVPLTLCFFMEYSMTIISLFIIGHLCTAEDLASASLAVMTYNITGLSIIEGLASALDTMCSQAYGSQKFSKVGLYFLRCSALIMVASAFMVISWWFSASWLAYIVLEKDLLPQVQSYLRVLVIGLPGLIFFETGKRYLQSQGYYQAGTWTLAIVLPINAALIYTFTSHLGFIGAPIGIVVSQWLMSFILYCYARYMIPESLKCWYPFTDTWFHFKRVFSNWKPMWDLAFPGLIMIEAEYLSYEILTIMSTYFGVRAIAAQTVIVNLGSLVFQIAFAMGCVVSTRLANHVGMKQVVNAQTTIKAAYAVSVLIGIANCLLIVLFGRPLSQLFTNDAEVIERAYRVFHVLAINQLYDAVTTLGAAILRGQGRQKLGGIWEIVAYYLIALPLSWWFAFGPLHLEILGLWYGSGIGIFFLAVVFSFYIYNSNWDVIVSDFVEREAAEQDFDSESVASSAQTSLYGY